MEVQFRVSSGPKSRTIANSPPAGRARNRYHSVPLWLDEAVQVTRVPSGAGEGTEGLRVTGMAASASGLRQATTAKTRAVGFPMASSVNNFLFDARRRREVTDVPPRWCVRYTGSSMQNNHFSRREFVRSMAGGGAAALSAGGATAPRRPNIMVIMADDMGFSDIGCYGGEVQTPNIDRLAAGGLKFTQFYNNAKCCPTRSALLTGLYNHQAGVGNMVDNLGPPSYQGFLNEKCVTIAEALKDGGYTTLMSGKWHVGEERPHWPCDRGFDKYFGLISGSSHYFRVSQERPLAIDNEVYRPKDDSFYMTDIFGDNAVKFLDEYGRKEKPFFLYTAFTSPHWPLHALKEDIEKYRGKFMMGWDELRKRRHARMIEMGIVDRKWPLTPRDSEAPAWDSVSNKADFDLKMAVYAAQIDRMDQNIGRMMAQIEGNRGRKQHFGAVFGRQRRLFGRSGPRHERRAAGRARIVPQLRAALGQRQQYAVPAV